MDKTTDQNSGAAGPVDCIVVPPVPERDDPQPLAAMLVITPEALQELLRLPTGAYIDSVYSPHDRPGTLELRIRGAGWACTLGQRIRRTTVTVTVQRDAEGREMARAVDWGLPSSEERHNGPS
jgi:hypothetical protein